VAGGEKPSGSLTPVMFKMAKITRSSIMLEAQNLAGTQSAADSIPNQMANIVQPTLEINPRTTQLVRAVTATATGNTTIYTTPADKDFFLTFASISGSQNVACDNVIYYIDCVVGGTTRRIIVFDVQGSTAQSVNQVASFPYPIKLDRNSLVRVYNTFTAGASTKSAAIGGYILE